MHTAAFANASPKNGILWIESLPPLPVWIRGRALRTDLRSLGWSLLQGGSSCCSHFSLKNVLNSLQTLPSLQGFFQNLENNPMEIPSTSGVSESSPVFPVPLLRANSALWALSAIAGTWAHEKAAKTKLAKGHLRSLPAPSGSSTQIETLEAAPGWLARTHGSPSVLSVQL